MKKLMLIPLSFSVCLAGCTTMNNEGVGTVSGAVVGGLIGSQFGGGAGKVAAVAGGALLGAYLGGNIGKYMDRQDRMEMQRALESGQTGKQVSWNNPDNGNHYTVTPMRTYYVQEQPCREYMTDVIIDGRPQQMRGKACRQPDGTWRPIS